MLSLCCVCIGGIQSYGGIQTYRGCTNVWADRHPLSLTKHAFFVLCMYREHSDMWGNPNIQGASKHMRGIQMYGVLGEYRQPLILTKHAFFVWCMYRGYPNIMGPSKYTGGYPNIWGHPNIEGMYKCMGAYRHPLSLTKHAFFVLCVALMPVTEFYSCQRECVGS